MHWFLFAVAFPAMEHGALGVRASVVVVHELSCSVPCGIKPMYPGLASGFLTTAPPGKSLEYSFVILFGNSEVMLKKNGNLYEFLETLDF